jgi:N-acetyl-gamma-glutamyl-phosphate reductase
MGGENISLAAKSVGVVGASGFTGAELLRVIDRHPVLEVVVLQAATQAGEQIANLYPSMTAAYGGGAFSEFDIDKLDGLDVVFLGLPHEASMEIVPSLSNRVGHVVDLSAAFRLTDASQYPMYYGFDHDQPEALAKAVYGLPEFHRDELLEASLIATPGCYVTAAILAVRPLVDAGLISSDTVIVDAASGVTGAGRKEDLAYSFTTVDENFTAYGLLRHRHTPEMEQEIGARVLFTPHLLPMNRGILATCYSTPAHDGARSQESVMETLQVQYANEPFVKVIDGIPGTKATLGSNLVLVTGRYDERTDTIITISALDNLAKGASGGAIQALNVALGIDETSGLDRIGVAP